MTLIAITNPSDTSAESSIVKTVTDEFQPADILAYYGSMLENCAQVALIDNERVWQYIVARYGDSIALRDNNVLSQMLDSQPNISDEDNWLAIRRDAPLQSKSPPEEYTVIGTNDDDERFIAVLTATCPQDAHDKAVAAGLVDEGDEYSVCIHCILRGNHSVVAEDVNGAIVVS